MSRTAITFVTSWVVFVLTIGLVAVTAASSSSSTPCADWQCSFHASQSVLGPSGTCTCTQCRNQWTGSTCQLCPVAFDSTQDCGACFTSNGYGGQYPACVSVRCTQDDCNGRAMFVQGLRTDPTGCQCRCLNGYAGTKCELCPPQFDPSPAVFCGTCAVGYSGYPVCDAKCTVNGQCGGHAHSVWGTVHVGCHCSCKNAWTGQNCTVCPNLMDPAADCSRCLAGYERVGTACVAKCTNALNCNGRAILNGVSGNVLSGCVCACRNAYFGPSCALCPVGLSPAQDCSSCATGFGDYPNCSRACVASTDCNGRAVAVTGYISSGCTCTCRNQWAGQRGCDVCPLGFDATKDCGACLPGFVGYPQCTRGCTVADNCANHALSVTGNTYSGCHCICRNAWTDRGCDRCPDGVGGNDCNACLPGYIGVPPNCVKDCDIARDCGVGASAVAAVGPTCVCQCRNHYTGSLCDVCPLPWIYDAARFYDCDTCDQSLYAAALINNQIVCFEKCTIARNCSSHATAVSGSARPGSTCRCQCTGRWYGSDCSQCPAAFDASSGCVTCSVLYGGPDCSQKRCTSVNDCNGQSVAVSGFVGNCTCQCDPMSGWEGPGCSTCNARFDLDNGCRRCRYGYENFPRCSRQCTFANCSNNAEAVSGNDDDGCVCVCRNGYNGTNCGVCPPAYVAALDCAACAPGYAGYPTCGPVCNSVDDCSSRATVVTGGRPTCQCTCRNAYTGLACELCLHPYNAYNDCGSCVRGYDSFPMCYLTCTVQANCTNHAINVSGNTNTGCTCACRSGWTGRECETCPRQYDASKDCAVCNAGYTGVFPNCTRICTNIDDCNGHATATQGLFPNCLCTCNATTQWGGGDCGLCSDAFDWANNCYGCGRGFEGTYPSCVRTCTVQNGCSNHATDVSGNFATGCRCTCLNHWTGLNCSTCPVGFNSSANADCASCASGYVGYPNCQRKCTSAMDCNNRGAYVTGLEGSCKCYCRTGWEGDSCELCNFPRNPDPDCNSCRSGYEHFPHCYHTCTIAANCSGNAAAVSGNSNTGCQCICRNQWSGLNCSTCAHPLNITNNCGSCVDGYEGYPYCQRVCSVDTDCSGRATSVSGLNPNCLCQCKNGFAGTACEICPVQFNASDPDCASCARGYERYPACYRQCTVAEHCNGHAVNASGNTVEGCHCQCRNQWSGLSCDACALRFNTSDDCGSCNTNGYVTSDYPRCPRICTTVDDCSNRATNVSGTEGSCRCDCATSWAGNACELCPDAFDAMQFCSRCARGYRGTYPQCIRVCTNALDCSDHAANVTGDVESGCQCTCRNQWTSTATPITTTMMTTNASSSSSSLTPSCSVCPVNISAASDCSECEDGFGGYPNCQRKCTSAMDCSNRGAYVTGLEGSCKCYCRTGWEGASCELCNFPRNPDPDCNRCRSGYEHFPHCYHTCTIAANCSGNAAAVSGNSNTGCQCICKNQWSGLNCSTCAHPLNMSDNCGSCVDGYEGYPYCARRCTNATDCNRRATEAVLGLEPYCLCQGCRNQFTGSACEKCLSPYDIAKDCAACLPGYEDYPRCHRTCTSQDDCNGHAATVTGNSFTGCTCHCRNQWEGDTCALCPEAYDNSSSATADCNRCGRGFNGNYPACFRACTDDGDCSGRGIASGNTNIGCTCQCFNQYNGSQCEVCDARFDQNQCAACAAGHVQFPTCVAVCTPENGCNNNAKAATGLHPNCRCTCYNQWQGAHCDLCPAQYDAQQACGTCARGRTNYPVCSVFCTIPLNCSNHANTVTDTPSGSCACECRNAWTGRQCEVCPENIDPASDCSVCRPGYHNVGGENPPKQCTRLCTKGDDCNNHATAVSGISGSCQCTCRNRWQGLNCSTCPPTLDASRDCGACALGFSSYPACSRPCSTATDCSDNNRATAVSGVVTTQNFYQQPCTCTCADQWSGADCSFCDANRFDTTSSCNRCRAPRVIYPLCLLPCTSAANCNNRAVNVSGFVDRSSCECQCRNQWSGANCSTCAPQYDASKDCGACRPDFEDYPTCSPACKLRTECGPGAIAVTGDPATRCLCVCSGAFYGDRCDLCPPTVDNSDGRCSRCARGYANFPHCRKACTSARDCNGRAASVAGDREVGCECTCQLPFAGQTCDTCPFNYNQGTNCSTCAAGFVDFPLCKTACAPAEVQCLHGRPVQDPASKRCTCFCQDGWAGPTCELCPARYDASADCRRCARGYLGTFPFCLAPEDFPPPQVSCCGSDSPPPPPAPGPPIISPTCGFYECPPGVKTKHNQSEDYWGGGGGGGQPGGFWGGNNRTSNQTSPDGCTAGWYYFGASGSESGGWYNSGCGGGWFTPDGTPGGWTRNTPNNTRHNSPYPIPTVGGGPGAGLGLGKAPCGPVIESATCVWLPGTFSATIEQDEALLNTFLQTVSCGTTCIYGAVVERFSTTAGQQQGGGTEEEGYAIEIMVRSPSAFQSELGAQCLLEVMRNGAFWPFEAPAQAQTSLSSSSSSSSSLAMVPAAVENDPTLLSGCASGTLPWEVCASFCYEQFHTHRNYSCCDRYPNRCYYWNCSRYKDACTPSYQARCGEVETTTTTTTTAALTTSTTTMVPETTSTTTNLFLTTTTTDGVNRTTTTALTTTPTSAATTTTTVTSPTTTTTEFTGTTTSTTTATVTTTTTVTETTPTDTEPNRTTTTTTTVTETTPTTVTDTTTTTGTTTTPPPASTETTTTRTETTPTATGTGTTTSTTTVMPSTTPAPTRRKIPRCIDIPACAQRLSGQWRSRTGSFSFSVSPTRSRGNQTRTLTIDPLNPPQPPTTGTSIRHNETDNAADSGATALTALIARLRHPQGWAVLASIILLSCACCIAVVLARRRIRRAAQRTRTQLRRFARRHIQRPLKKLWYERVKDYGPYIATESDENDEDEIDPDDIDDTVLDDAYYARKYGIVNTDAMNDDDDDMNLLGEEMVEKPTSTPQQNQKKNGKQTMKGQQGRQALDGPLAVPCLEHEDDRRARRGGQNTSAHTASAQEDDLFLDLNDDDDYIGNGGRGRSRTQSSSNGGGGGSGGWLSWFRRASLFGAGNATATSGVSSSATGGADGESSSRGRSLSRREYHRRNSVFSSAFLQEGEADDGDNTPINNKRGADSEGRVAISFSQQPSSSYSSAAAASSPVLKAAATDTTAATTTTMETTTAPSPSSTPARAATDADEEEQKALEALLFGECEHHHKNNNNGATAKSGSIAPAAATAAVAVAAQVKINNTNNANTYNCDAAVDRDDALGVDALDLDLDLTSSATDSPQPSTMVTPAAAAVPPPPVAAAASVGIPRPPPPPRAAGPKPPAPATPRKTSSGRTDQPPLRSNNGRAPTTPRKTNTNATRTTTQGPPSMGMRRDASPATTNTTTTMKTTKAVTTTATSNNSGRLGAGSPSQRPSLTQVPQAPPATKGRRGNLRNL